ncbi:non-ribosomal peptide synthetase [Nocardia sp. BMG51109]|uniref:non-ribosomal peptide synthetase n=1 Tax=Nocardia sp. BMG51109 TaxID=1056816 RepID=UPI000463E9D4|nr:non-ribosomal peptide synthetase [Nocardia sp. BMG51109]
MTGIRLSRAQEEIWLAQSPLGRRDPYLAAEIVVLTGPLDTVLLARAARWVAEHDETASWIVADDAGELRFAASPDARETLEIVDLSDSPNGWTSAWRLLSGRLSAPVGAAAERAWALVLVRLAGDRNLLAWRGHHVLLDGHTARLRLSRIAAAYRALCRGTAPSIADDPGVGTVLRAESAYRESAAYAADRAHWLAALGRGGTAGPAAEPSGLPVRVRRSLGAELSVAVESRAAQRPGVSATVVGCFAIALGSAANGRVVQDGGTVRLELSVSGRDSDALRRTTGVTANRVPLLLTVRPAATLAEVTASARTAIWRALPHQRYRREDMRRDLLAAGLPVSTGAGVNMMLFDEQRPDFGTAAAAILPWNYGPVADLELTVHRPVAGGALALELAGDPARYRRPELRALLDRLCELIARAAGSPHIRVRDVAAPAAVRWQGWPTTFAEQVDRTPFAPAVALGDRSLSYRQLDRWCGRLAGRLSEQGVGKGDVVAVAGGPAPLTAAAVPALWRLGAIYLPLDLDQPEDQVRHRLSVATPVALLTGADTVLPECCADIRVIRVEAMPAGELGDAAAPPPVPIAPGDGAYLLFTSGSSGAPKGVLVGHRGIPAMARALAAALDAGAGARVLQFAATTFDASIAELTLALCSGATAVFTPPGQPVSGSAIAELIGTHGVTHLIMVPSVLATVPEDRVPGGLRIVVAGEAPSRDVLSRWCVRHRVRNAYGPTEATVCTTIGEVSGGAAPAPIGWAIPGTTVRVVDERLRPVPPGEVGELLIGGDGVALGYLGLPELTAARFVPGADGVRRYRSGDLVRELADGQLEFAGRLDRQIKLRGRRIEPGEVEAALVDHPAVRQAAVVAAGEQLVAYAVAAGTVAAGSLRAHLAQRLPRHLCPDRVIRCDRLPLTRHGKLDYGALAAGAEAAAPPAAPDAARSPQEHLLCRLFAEVLGHERVGRSDDFFDLGGQSMAAARLVLRVRAVLGIDLSMRTLLEAPTPAGLAELMHAPDGLSGSLDVLLPLRRTGTRPPLFCVHPATGLSWCYAGLLRYLPDRPVIGLQARAMGDPAYRPESVEELAADYLARVGECTPNGPYHLLGWSFGGRVAFEMATVLQGMGHEVGSVVLLDSSPPPPVAFEASTADFDRDDALRRYFLAILAETSPISDDAYRDAPLPEIKAELDRLAGPYSLLSDNHFQRMFELHKRNYVLSRRYVPRRKLHGRLDYVRALGEGGEDTAHKVDRWAAHVDGDTVEHRVPGTHGGLTQAASIAQIGRLLAGELDRNERTHAAAR